MSRPSNPSFRIHFLLIFLPIGAFWRLSIAIRYIIVDNISINAGYRRKLHCEARRKSRGRDRGRTGPGKSACVERFHAEGASILLVDLQEDSISASTPSVSVKEPHF